MPTLTLEAIDADLRVLRDERRAQVRTTPMWWVTWREDVDRALGLRFELSPVKVLADGRRVTAS